MGIDLGDELEPNEPARAVDVNDKFAVVEAALDADEGEIIVGDGAGGTHPATMSGDATINGDGAVSLAPNSVGPAEIAPNSVDTDELADGAATSEKADFSFEQDVNSDAAAVGTEWSTYAEITVDVGRWLFIASGFLRLGGSSDPGNAFARIALNGSGFLRERGGTTAASESMYPSWSWVSNIGIESTVEVQFQVAEGVSATAFADITAVQIGE